MQKISLLAQKLKKLVFSLHKSENSQCHALLKLKIEHLYLHVYEKRACMQKISLLPQKFKKLVFSLHKIENLPCQALLILKIEHLFAQFEQFTLACVSYNSYCYKQA